MDYTLLNGLTLAYIGDVIYEQHIRIYLVNKGFTKVNDLHKAAIKYTSTKGQYIAIRYLIDNVLTEEEMIYFKRGRNQTTAKRKSATQEEYQHGTGFESLIGFLYLTKKIERLEEIINISIKLIEGGA